MSIKLLKFEGVFINYNSLNSSANVCLAWSGRDLQQLLKRVFFLLFPRTADGRSDTGAERRLQDIVARRKLVDLAKAQAQEVAVLRAEVERLRMRTFPALVQIEH